MDYKASLKQRINEAIEAVKASLPEAEPKLTTAEIGMDAMDALSEIIDEAVDAKSAFPKPE